MISKRKLPSMRIELISEDIYSFAEVISEYETSVLTVKLRGRTLIGWADCSCQNLCTLHKSSSMAVLALNTHYRCIISCCIATGIIDAQ